MSRLFDDEDLRKAAGGWEAPPYELRENLRPHDVVQLLFSTPDGVGGEAMWVEILRTRPYRYEGVLLNDPVWLRDVQAGDVVEFEPRHVADILPPGPKSWSPSMGALWDPFRPKKGEKPSKLPEPAPPKPPEPAQPALPMPWHEGPAPHREPLPGPKVIYLPYLGPIAEHEPPKAKWYEAFGPPTLKEKGVIVRPSGELAPAVPPSEQLPAKPIPKVFEIFKPAEPPPPPAAVPTPPQPSWVEAVLPEEERARLKPKDKPADIWDALVPEEAKTGPELAPEDLFAPSPKEKERARRTARKAPPVPTVPSQDAILKALQDMFFFDAMLEDVRESREHPEFQRAKQASVFTGEPALIPLASIAAMYMDYSWIVDFATALGAREEEWAPWMDFLESAADVDDSEEAMQLFHEELFEPLMHQAIEALEKITPKDLPGRLVLDTQYDEVMLAYWEPPSEEEVKRIEEERREMEAKAKREYENRKASLQRKLKGWGLPNKAALEARLQDELDLKKVISKIRRMRKRPSWKRELEHEGRAMIELETIGPSDENVVQDFGAFMGFPEHVGEAYANEGLLYDYQGEVITPISDMIKQIFAEWLPEDLPGVVEILLTPERTVVLGYYESTEEG